MIFRKLTDEQESEFRVWARENYKPGSEISLLWHPAVQEECAKMNRETLIVKENS